MTVSAGFSFNKVLSFIEKLSGIQLPETNYRYVKSYLDERLNELELSIEEYLSILNYNTLERNLFFDAVTINETYFFREQKHFAVLQNTILPDLKARRSGPLRLWSAACSSGEEAVSLAAAVLPEWNTGNFTVYASDINTVALDKLSAGRYRKSSLREDGSVYHHLLQRFLAEDGEDYLLDERIKNKIIPMHLNLADSKYKDLPQDIDIVFLRNMLIYVGTGTRELILERIVSHMSPGGFLFLSSAEIPLLAHVELVLENRNGCYYFRKKSRAEKNEGCVPEPVMLGRGDLPLVSQKLDFKIIEKSVKKPQLAEILKHISLRLNNPVYKDNESIAYLAALDYLETAYLLNSGDLQKAGAAVDRLTEKWGSNEMTDYFRGLTALRNNDFEKALQMFGSAVRRNSVFWPSLYQRALLQKETKHREAARDFKNCARLIDSYISRGEFTYQFLLEGFNAKYFAEICRGWISKMELKGA